MVAKECAIAARRAEKEDERQMNIRPKCEQEICQDLKRKNGEKVDVHTLYHSEVTISLTAS